MLFERDDFPDHTSTYEAQFRQHRLHERKRDPCISKSETCLLDDVREVVGTRHEGTNPEMSLFDFGLSSLDLFRIKQCIDRRLDISLPVIAIFKTNGTSSLQSNRCSAHPAQARKRNALRTKHFANPQSQTGSLRLMVLCNRAPISNTTSLWYSVARGGKEIYASPILGLSLGLCWTRKVSDR